MNTPFLAGKTDETRKNISRILRIALAALFLCPLSALAQCNETWSGGANGTWNTAGNWTPANVPTSSTNTCIDTAGSTVMLNISGAATADLTLGSSTDSLSFNNGTSLTVSGSTISNAGAITMNSTGNATELLIGAANVTLSGTGTLTMSNNSNNFIFGTAASNTLIDQSTIQGSGNIGDGQMALNNSGTIDANQSTNLILQISNGATNTGTLEATAGGTLVVQGGTYTNTGGTIEAAAGSTVQFISGAVINGGTVTQTGGTIELPSFTSSTIAASVVNPANGGQVKIDNGAFLTMGAGSSISNAGTITMNSTGNATELLIGAANVTLSGTGTLTMSNNTNNFILGTLAANQLTNQSTIQGSGNIGDGQMALNNSGTIDANQSSSLTLQISNGATNTGTLEATAGGTLILNGGTYTNAGGSIVNNASTVEFTGGVTVNGGTVSQTGAGTLKLASGTVNAPITNSSTGIVEAVGFTSSTIGGTLTNPSGGQVNIDNGAFLILGTGSSVANAGTITMNSTGNATELQIGAASVTLSGAGTLTMSNNSNNFIFGTAASNTLINQSTIQGSGNIGDGQMALNNSGTIDANQSTNLILQISNGATNTGTLEATAGGTLVVQGGTYTNTGGTIEAAAGSTVQFISGAVINGGTVTQTGGTIELPSFTSSTIAASVVNPANGGQVKIDNGAFLTMGAGSSISNAGTITMNSTGNATELLIGAANVTLSGTGTLTMSNNTNNFILGTLAANQLTNQSTIQGSGNIGDGQMALNNSGTIDANQSSSLTLQISNGATNTGTLEATAGGTLILNGGTYTNAGGSIVNNASTVEFTGGVTVNGGTVSQTGAGTLKLASGTVNAPITNSSTGIVEAVGFTSSTIGGTLTNPSGGQVNIDNGAFLILGTGSSVANAGTITMNSTGNATELQIGAASVTLSGAGTLTMSNNTNNFIFGTAASNTLINQSTIQGSGNIGDGQMALNNSGTIDANQTATLTLQISNGAANTGTLEATSGATLTVNGGTYTQTGSGKLLASGTNSEVLLENATIVGGTLTSASGGKFVAENSSTLNGVTISSGTTLDIINGQFLDLAAGTITSKGTINLQSSGNTTELVINGNVTLAGTGKVILSANSNNFILGNGGTLTNQNTIEGEGNIGDGSIGLVNTGTISANEAGAHTPSTLIIQTNGTGFSNSSGTKNGTISVSAKNTLIIEGGPFNNFSGGTLTGGIYKVTGTLEFNAGSTGIVTNDAAITLTSSTSKILNSFNSTDALASSFTTNGAKGSFTLAGGRNFTTPGAFSNAGIVVISKGTTFTVGGTNSYTQTGGTTTVSGKLVVASPGGVDVSGGSVFGIGTITGNIDLTGGLLSPGAATKKAGELSVTGTYSQSGSGILNIDLGGTTAGTNYDVLNISGAAALGGTLNVDGISGFNPTAGQQYDILDYSSETGTFSAVNCTFSNGDGCTIAYNATGAVLTITAPAARSAAKPAALGSVNGTSERWMRSASLIASGAGIAHEPSAILAPAETCSGLRSFASFACLTKAFSGVAASAGSTLHSSGGSERASATFGTLHNNVAARAGAGASHAPDTRTVSAASLARLYVCAYLPSEVASTMGCR